MDELKAISKYAGMREDLVQAGGGNTSVKISDERMYIKASGCQLADVSMESGCALVNPKKIVEFFINTPLGEIGREQEKDLLDMALIEGGRPSIETFLHAVTGRVTLHTHPVFVNILAVRSTGMDELKKLFPDAMFVPYATPGISLAKEYFQAWLEKGRKTSGVIFLKNHGLVVSGETAEEAISRNEEVVETLAKYLGMEYSPYQAATQIYNLLAEIYGEGDVVYLSQNRHVYEAYQKLGGMWRHETCPDCIVYCGKKILELSDEQRGREIKTYCAAYGKPIVIKCRDSFYIVAPTVKKAKETESILAFSAQVALGNSGKNIDFLSDGEQDFLLGWDAEKYRRNIK